MKTILVFEPLAGGHRANYIRWLADSIVNNPPPGCHFIFVTNSGVDVPSGTPVSPHKISQALAQRLAVSGPAELRRRLRVLFHECAAEYSPDHALILELTRMELSFALRGAPCPLSAILFVQYPELPHGLKFFVKEQKTALMLKRAPVRNLFLLNGEESCRYLTSRFGSHTRFIAVPDPAPSIRVETGYSLRREYRIDSARKVFLFFGYISPRKGADVLIKALKILPAEISAQSAFIFCGEPEHGCLRTFEHACSCLRAARPDIQLNVNGRFVSDERMMALFEQTDAVLMPYIRPEYSSGILALAAKARTPVIGPDAGLLGRLIRLNGLGDVCPVCPEAVAKSIANAVRSLPVVDEERCSAFVQKSSPEEFAHRILKAVCDEY